MAGKAKFKKTYGTKLKDQTTDIKQLYSLAGSTGSPRASTMSFGVAGGSSTPPAIDEYARLKTSGDTMVGGISYFPKAVVVDVDDEIDIVQGGVGALDDSYSSYLYLTSLGVAPHELETINGASHLGQLLHIETVPELTLKHNTGNIAIPNEEDFTVEAGGFCTLLYDGAIHTDGGNAHWVLVSSSSVAGSGANTTLSNLESPTAINQSLLPDTDNFYDLGSETNEWARIYIDTMAHLDGVSMGGAIDMNEESVVDIEAIQFANVATDVLGAYATITGDATGSMIFNVPTDNNYIFQVNEVPVATLLANGSLTCNGLIDDGSVTGIILNDASAEPIIAGQFKRDGTDVFVYSGGASRNMTDIGTGGGSGANTSLSNLNDPTSCSESLIPSSVTKHLGSSGNNWGSVRALSGIFSTLSMSGDVDMNNHEITDCGQLDVTQIDARGTATAIAIGDDLDLDALGKFIRFDDSTSVTVSGSSATVNGGGGLSCEAFLKIKIGSAVKYIPYFS